MRGEGATSCSANSSGRFIGKRGWDGLACAQEGKQGLRGLSVSVSVSVGEYGVLCCWLLPRL